MQEAIVFILFFGIIAYIVYRMIRKPKNDGGCSSCGFNPENQG